MSSDRITLNDLRVTDGLKRIRGRQIVNEDRSATLDDLIQVLKGMGAEIEEAHVAEGYTKVDTPGLGSYLVLRLPGDKK